MIDLKEFEHLEKLSRIQIVKDKIDEYITKISGIVSYIGRLQEVDTKGVLPTAQVTNLSKALREDEVKESLSQQDVLKNSKHIQDGYFKVPKVVE